MLFIGLFSWWYTAGWLLLGRRLQQRIVNVLDFFSIGLLLRTLFAPFRQLSVGQVKGPINVQLRAWADRQISRGIGAMVRLTVILFGLLALAFTLIVVGLIFILWPLLPIAPLVAIIIIIASAS